MMKNSHCTTRSCVPARVVRTLAVLALAGVAYGAGMTAGQNASDAAKTGEVTTPRGFRVHTVESAPAQSREMLAGVQKGMGFVPHLLGTLSESPVALEAYSSLSGVFNKSSLSPVERNVVLLTASVENRCTYCVPAHTAYGQLGLKMNEQALNAIRNNEPIDDARLEALRQFTRAVVANRGDVEQEQLDAFMNAGYTRAQALDVVVGVGLKTLSNYTNRLVDEPVDNEWASFKWTPAAER